MSRGKPKKPKLFRLHPALVLLLEKVSETTKQEQTALVSEAIAAYMERKHGHDSALASMVQEYRESVGQKPPEIPEHEIPEEYR